MTQYTASMKQFDKLLQLGEVIADTDQELRVLSEAFNVVGNKHVGNKLWAIRRELVEVWGSFKAADQERSQAELNAARGAVGDILKELVAPSNKELA